MTELILVDDTDSGISYDGPWFPTTNTFLTIGNFGPPFQRTLHGVNASGSLTYTFTGTQVTVIGSNIVSTSGVAPTDPSWECFVDETSTGTHAPFAFSENGWTFCESGTLSSGSHVLRVAVTVLHQNTFWFDRIQYVPTPETSLAGRMVYIDDSDERVSYGDGWNTLDSMSHQTQTNGSTATISFTGTSLTWYSFIPNGFPSPSAEASYSIDGGPETTFSIPGLAVGATDLYNQVPFQIPSLPSGDHSIRVTHRGNNEQAPLTLDYVVVRGSEINASGPGTSSGSSSSSSSSSSTSQTGVVSPSVGGGTRISSGIPGSPTTPTASTGTSSSSTNPASVNNHQSKPLPVGAIAGLVVGGFVLIIIPVVWLLLRRRKPRPSLLPPLEYSPIYPIDSDRKPQGSKDGLLGDSEPVNRALAVQGTSATLLTGTPPSDGDSVDPQEVGRVVRHQDSGVRVRPPMLELPPEYTPS